MAEEVKVDQQEIPPQHDSSPENAEDSAEPEGVVSQEQVEPEDSSVKSENESVGEQDEESVAEEKNEKKIEPKKVNQAEFQQFTKGDKLGEKQNIQMLLDVTLPVSIELGRAAMSIGEILELGPGSVVELEKLAGEPVDVLVNEKIVARGEVVVVDENFGVRITQLFSKSDLIKNL